MEEEESNYDESDDDDYEEESDEGQLNLDDIPISSMSPNLLRSLGLLVDEQIPTVATDWKPPERSGLDNSAPIVGSQQNNISSNERRVSFSLGGEKTAIKLAIEREKTETENSDEESEEYTSDYDDDYNFAENNDLTSFATMSPNLMKLLGMNISENVINNVTDWEPPAKSGLSNSKPLVPTVQTETTRKTVQASIFSEDLLQTLGLEPSINPIPTRKPLDSESEEESSEDDSIDDRMGFASMSPNLMRVLGLIDIPTDVKKTVDQHVDDWKPPDTFGLQNSKPIFQTNGNSKQSTNESKDSEDDDENDDDEFDDSDGESIIGDIKMSPNLMRLLGLEVPAASETESKTDWKPPTTWGLGNSEPIFPKHQRFNPVPPAVDNPSPKLSSDEESYYETESETENENEKVPKAMMPSSLLKLFGVSLEAEVSSKAMSDWKPPSDWGLLNSEPLIPKHRIKDKEVRRIERSSFIESKQFDWSPE